MTYPIQITTHLIGTEKTNTVNARVLHKVLKIKKDFSDWIKYQIKSLGLEKDLDYITILQKRGVANSGYKVVTEYIITIDAAKHIAMASRSAKGKEVRRYFIEVEKRYRNAITTDSTKELAEALRVLGEGMKAIAQTVQTLDVRVTRLEAVVGGGMARGLVKMGKQSASKLVAQAYESRRAAFMEAVCSVLSFAEAGLNQSEVLRRCGYRRDDKTARKWLGGGVGIYWEITPKGRSLIYTLAKEQKEAA